jgi:D-sedoheptulose 7-phosphate isomerase
MKTLFFEKYFDQLTNKVSNIDQNILIEISKKIVSVNKLGGKIILVGNGGSSSIAGHLTIDCINAAKIKAVNFNDAGIITCFSNDYGYKNWISKALECYSSPGDVLVLISSSGQSENMLIGANKAKSLGVDVVTLTGFSADNSLRRLGDINLWVDSNKYNMVEITHHIWLLAIVDYIIENSKGKSI